MNDVFTTARASQVAQWWPPEKASLVNWRQASNESLAVQILSGAVVASGEMEAEVTAIGAETFFGKTIALLGAPEEKGHLFKVLSNVTPAAPCLNVLVSPCTKAAFLVK